MSYDPDEMTIAFTLSGPMFRAIEDQAKAVGVEPHEWAKKLVLAGARAGLPEGWKPQADWRFVVARQALVFETFEEAEKHAAEAAAALKADVLVVPTDKTFLANALVAKWVGVVMDEVKL